MKVTIIGAGYVGLVTAACLAEAGHDVICFDSNHDKIVRLRAGAMPVFERGLAPMVLRNRLASRLHFTDDAQEMMAFAAVIFIAVDTPASSDGSTDLTNIFRVAHGIGAQHAIQYWQNLVLSTWPFSPRCTLMTAKGGSSVSNRADLNSLKGQLKFRSVANTTTRTA